MQNAGIVAEYNPFHRGHALLIQRTRVLLGPSCTVTCVMSGNFVQRGDFALLEKHARAEAAVAEGADLVLELPLPWAVSSAERFADGGVGVLSAVGAITHLAFGSECGDSGELLRAARGLRRAEFPGLLRRELADGVSFAAARQQAAEKLLGADGGKTLESPNNILGVEYCKSLLRRGSAIEPLTIRREGAPHDGVEVGKLPSASALRALLTGGERERGLELLPPAMREIYLREEAAGRAPVQGERCQRAILARLRSMDREAFAALDEGREGLGNRLYAASRSAATLEELLETAKTKRYALSRLRRMVLWAYLGLTPGELPAEPPYLRVLAANGRGRELLHRVKKTAAVPILTKPADSKVLPGPARQLFEQEARATDLYTLAYPSLSAAIPGGEWRVSPVML